jgi:hypothetical protein
MKGRQGRLDIKRIPTFSRLTFDADDKRITCTVLPRVTLIRSEKSKRAWKPSRCEGGSCPYQHSKPYNGLDRTRGS